MILEDHKRCICGDNTLKRYTDNVSIRSYKHQPMTIILKKLTYTNHDDKRYVLDNNIHTLTQAIITFNNITVKYLYKNIMY